MKFMSLPEEYSNEKSEFVILPIKYEKDVTYGKGASLGPDAIIEASQHLEYYDEQFDIEGFEKGIRLLESLELNDMKPNEMVETIREASFLKTGVINETIQKNKNKFIIGLGGDHSVTIGLTKNLDENVSVIILDAHADMFHSWNGSEYNHRCTANKISNNHKTLLVGVRSMDKDENDIILEKENVDMIKSYDFNMVDFKKKLKNLNDKIYISIDVDVFDPSFIRNTGTPEPGGFFWNEVIEILKTIFESKEVIGADIVEFAPKENSESESYALAKLVYKLINMKQKFN